MKIVKSLEESGLLTKRISETIKNETKNKKVDFSNIIRKISRNIRKYINRKRSD